jgi:hypothetical protein
MDCGQCEPMVQAVRQHYAYLFAEYGFRRAHCEDPRQGEHCLIVLESDRGRVKFEIDQGTPVVYFGTLDSPISWANEIDGVPLWHVTHGLLNFVEHKNEAATPAPEAGSERGTEELLAAQAERRRPQAAELLAAFVPDRSADWWREFDAYQAERLKQIRQRYGTH